jgi:hypothetical protein
LSSLFEPPDPSFDGLSAGAGPRPQAQQVAAAALTDDKFRAPPDVAPPAAPAGPAIDREAIAKAMAKAAMAKLAAQPAAAAPAPAVAAAPAPAPAPKPAPKPAVRPAPPPPAKAARPMSALEAARLASAAEDAARSAAAQEASTRPVAPAPAAAAPAPAPAAPAPVAPASPVAAPVAPVAPPVAAAAPALPLLSPTDAARAALRSLGGEVDVPLRGAVAAPRGPVLGVLWKSHRLRALAEGDLALAHAASRVTEAVDSAPDSLVVALAGAAGQEHLLFVDARGGRLLAVCSNARAYLAATGLQL